MPGCKTITIVTEDIVPKASKMLDKLGRMDLLGQILHTGYGIDVHSHHITPACTNHCVHPFTSRIRNICYNTELTLTLLRNAKYTGLKQLELANELLEEHDIILEQA